MGKTYQEVIDEFKARIEQARGESNKAAREMEEYVRLMKPEINFSEGQGVLSSRSPGDTRFEIPGWCIVDVCWSTNQAAYLMTASVHGETPFINGEVLPGVVNRKDATIYALTVLIKRLVNFMWDMAQGSGPYKEGLMSGQPETDPPEVGAVALVMRLFATDFITKHILKLDERGIVAEAERSAQVAMLQAEHAKDRRRVHDTWDREKDADNLLAAGRRPIKKPSRNGKGKSK